MSRTVYVSLSAAALAVVGTLVLAGPLSPPSGPIASTYKTLSEVEPRIAINATNTPGDALNSFIISQPGSYYLTGNITGVSGKSGIKITASNVTLDLNGFTLQGVAGSQYGIIGFVFPNNCMIHNGTIDGWGLVGVFLGSPGGSGSGTIVEHIVSHGNSSGISVASYSIVRDCVATSNNGFGIAAAAHSTITNCVSEGNQGIGIAVNNGIVDNCSSSNNGTHGISASGSVVRGNICNSNGTAVTDGCGISASGNCRIESNHCSSNDTGIETTSNSNQVDSNNCLNNLIGLNIAGTNNLITRNSVYGGLRFNISANNAVAPIVTVAGSNSWPAIANSNHPMANYGY